jgi:hypothetical protein
VGTADEEGELNMDENTTTTSDADHGNTPLPRAPDEIVAKIKELDGPDGSRLLVHLLSFHREVMVMVLPWSHAKEFLENTTEEEWLTLVQPATVEHQTTLAREYAEFAWGKAVDHRGISAGRSVEKLNAWLWLLGRDHEVDWTAFMPYGVPILAQVCRVMGWPIPDPSERTAGGGTLGRMLEGRSCSPDCDSGCSE